MTKIILITLASFVGMIMTLPFTSASFSSAVVAAVMVFGACCCIDIIEKAMK